MLAAITYDTDFAENVEANQYVARLILFTETACYGDSYPKYFGVKERMDGKGREITIGRTDELSGKLLQVLKVNV